MIPVECACTIRRGVTTDAMPCPYRARAEAQYPTKRHCCGLERYQDRHAFTHSLQFAPDCQPYRAGQVRSKHVTGIGQLSLQAHQDQLFDVPAWTRNKKQAR